MGEAMTIYPMTLAALWSWFPPSCYGTADTSSDDSGIPPDVALPKAKDEPTGTLEQGRLTSVALHIRPNLGDPVWRVVPCLQLPDAYLEIAAVPEISVAEYGHSGADKDHVGFARQSVRGYSIA
jgi:hypothetical protein